MVLKKKLEDKEKDLKVASIKLVEASKSLSEQEHDSLKRSRLLKRCGQEKHRLKQSEKESKQLSLELEKELEETLYDKEEEVNALQNQLQDQQFLNEDSQLQIGDEVVIVKVKNRRGQLSWPQFVYQLILQLHARGTRTSAIP